MLMFSVVEITTKKQQPPYDISATVTVSNDVNLVKVNVSWISEGENMSIPAIEERHGNIIKSSIMANHNQLLVKLAVLFEKMQLWSRDIPLAKLLEETSGEM